MQKTNYLGMFLLACGPVACGGTDTTPTGEAGGSGGSLGGATHSGNSSGTSGHGGAATTGGTQGGGGSGTARGGAAGSSAEAAGGGRGGTSAAFAGASGSGGNSGSSGTSSAGAAGRGTSGRGAGGAGGGGTGTAGVGGRAGGSGTAAGGASGKAGNGSGGSTGSCTAPPDPSPLVGWASVSGNNVTTTTGGGTATPVTVTTLADFTSAVKGTDPGVIYVKGTLAPGKVSVGSNKTIAGLCGAEIHGHLELGGSTNVIVRNLTIVGYGVGDCSLDPDYDSGTGCSSGNDAVSVQKNAHHIWFDHCDISDGTDGNLDITNGANYVTVSWTKFHYTARKDPDGSDSTGDAGHRFSNLVGGTDSPSTYDDANSLNITWHHDWWAERVVERQPRVRFGKNHLFNNYWNAADDNYCVRAGIQARILIEDGVFDGVKDPHVFNNSDDENTANIIAGSDNLYPNATGTKATGGGGPAIGDLPYTYTPDAASTVSAAVQSGAGPQ